LSMRGPRPENMYGYPNALLPAQEPESTFKQREQKIPRKPVSPELIASKAERRLNRLSAKCSMLQARNRELRRRLFDARKHTDELMKALGPLTRPDEE
jgi:hypothetical protein